MIWVILGLVVLSLIFSIIAIFKEDGVWSFVVFWLLILILALSFENNEQRYKSGQVDAIRGNIRYEIFIPDSTNIQDWREVSE